MKKLKLIVLSTFFAAISLHAGIGVGISDKGTLPVELTSFAAEAVGNDVLLSWTTATEVNNFGFYVESKVANGVWIEISFVEGHGNSNSPKDYSFVDTKPLNGVVEYRLKQVDTDGKSTYSDVVILNSKGLNKYSLNQNYPNPFNPSTIISYSIPKASNVTVEVFDVLGNSIATLVNKNQEMGSYSVNFDASALSNGLYFYKISAGNFSSVKKMMLLK